MSASYRRKSPFGCQECKRKRIKCSNITPSVQPNHAQKPCLNCVRAAEIRSADLKCIYLDLDEQKELRKIRKILKSRAKITRNRDSGEIQLDDYVIIRRYIRGNESLESSELESGVLMSEKNEIISEANGLVRVIENAVADVVAGDDDDAAADIRNSDIRNPVADISTSDIRNPVADISTSDIKNSVSVADIASPTSSVLVSNWNFMFDDILNLMNTMDSVGDDFDMHESLEQDVSVDPSLRWNNHANHVPLTWQTLELFFSKFKIELDIDDNDINYFKIFYEKITYWIFPYQLIAKNNIINRIFFNYILSRQDFGTYESSSLKSDPLVLGMLSLAAKYQETILKIKGTSSSDSSRYADLAITHLNDKILKITKTKDVHLDDCIGSLTITILLLVIYNSSQNGSNWRSHQRGAKNIYLKYLKNKNSNSRPLSVVEKDLLTLFKQWFPTFDLLASFMSAEKGTLTTKEYNMYFKENEMDTINTSLVANSNHESQFGYNAFQGYGNVLMKLLVKLLDFVVLEDEKEVDLDFFFSIMADIDECRKYSYKKNCYGLLNKEELQFNSDEHGIVSVNGDTYSIFDMTHASHTNLVTIVFLQRLNDKNNNFVGLINKNFMELKQLISFMFKKDFEYKQEFERDLAALLESPHDVDLETFTDKLTFQRLLQPELVGDFKLLMFFSAIQIYATYLTREKPDYFEERCKLLCYCQCLYLNCGTTGCFTSFKYFISIWRQFDSQKEDLGSVNKKGLYNMSVPFV